MAALYRNALETEQPDPFAVVVDNSDLAVERVIQSLAAAHLPKH
jgi:hypothetical protein